VVSSWLTTFAPLTNDQVSVGTAVELSAKARVGVKIANVTHYVGVLAANTSTGKVTVNVSSTPQQRIMSIGEQWKVELTGDNNYDLLLTLNSISAANKANITIKAINETIVQETTGDQNLSANADVADQNANAGDGTSKKTSMSIKWIVIIIVAVIVIVAIIFFIKWKKNPELFYKDKVKVKKFGKS
jgi:flagellar basal body-associated protein FliL